MRVNKGLTARVGNRVDCCEGNFNIAVRCGIRCPVICLIVVDITLNDRGRQMISIDRTLCGSSYLGEFQGRGGSESKDIAWNNGVGDRGTSRDNSLSVGRKYVSYRRLIQGQISRFTSHDFKRKEARK